MAKLESNPDLVEQGWAAVRANFEAKTNNGTENSTDNGTSGATAMYLVSSAVAVTVLFVSSVGLGKFVDRMHFPCSNKSQ